MEDSASYRETSGEWGEKTAIEFAGNESSGGCILNSSAGGGWLFLNPSCCPILVCSIPMVGIGCRAGDSLFFGHLDFDSKKITVWSVLWPRCHNLKVRRFSQGLPCKTPLRTHSKLAMLLPSTQSGPNPWTIPIPKMPRLTQWKQDTDLALLGVRREFILKSGHRL